MQQHDATPANGGTPTDAWREAVKEELRRIFPEPPTTHRLKRDGAKDVTFTGWKIGEGFSYRGRKDDRRFQEHEYENEVSIFVLDDGERFVVHFARRSDFGDTERNEVRGAATSAELYNALLIPNPPRLGAAGADAWREACEKFPPLAPLATDSVDALFTEQAPAGAAEE